MTEVHPWTAMQARYDAVAERLGIHPDDVHSYMLDTTIRCDMCGAQGPARCPACIEKYDHMALLRDSAQARAIEAGCTLVFSDHKDEPESIFNATTDEHGHYGLRFAGVL